MNLSQQFAFASLGNVQRLRGFIIHPLDALPALSLTLDMPQLNDCILLLPFFAYIAAQLAIRAGCCV
jgi:hypothetical protein